MLIAKIVSPPPATRGRALSDTRALPPPPPPQTSALDDVNIEACYLATARAVIDERLLEEGSEASMADADTVDVTVATPRPGLYQRCCAIS